MFCNKGSTSSSSIIGSVLLLAAAFLPSVISQTTTPSGQYCYGTIRVVDFDREPTYNVNDNTFFTAAWAYNATACTGVPVASITLNNQDGGFAYRCPIMQFSSSGTLATTCTKTRGFIGTAAENGDIDWDISLRIGSNNVYYIVESDFVVTADTSSSTPSQAATRRRRYESDYVKRHGTPAPPQAAGLARSPSRLQPQQQSFICAKGASYCYTCKGMGFECIDTSTDVLSCGGCPHSEDKVDCSEIKGAGQVECRASTCHVVSCDSFHTLSEDGESCIPNGIARKRSLLRY